MKDLRIVRGAVLSNGKLEHTGSTIPRKPSLLEVSLEDNPYLFTGCAISKRGRPEKMTHFCSQDSENWKRRMRAHASAQPSSFTTRLYEPPPTSNPPPSFNPTSPFIMGTSARPPD